AEMEQLVAERSGILAAELAAISNDYPQLNPRLRGIGLIFGLQIEPPEIAQAIARECFARGVIVELCGPRRNVLKFLPPLIIEPSVLREGLSRVREAIEAILKSAAAS